jgi:hypothetical protein
MSEDCITEVEGKILLRCCNDTILHNWKFTFNKRHVNLLRVIAFLTTNMAEYLASFVYNLQILLPCQPVALEALSVGKVGTCTYLKGF